MQGTTHILSRVDYTIEDSDETVNGNALPSKQIMVVITVSPRQNIYKNRVPTLYMERVGVCIYRVR